jgi:hypothetical protein
MAKEQELNVTVSVPVSPIHTADGKPDQEQLRLLRETGGAPSPLGTDPEQIKAAKAQQATTVQAATAIVQGQAAVADELRKLNEKLEKQPPTPAEPLVGTTSQTDEQAAAIERAATATQRAGRTSAKE